MSPVRTSRPRASPRTRRSPARPTSPSTGSACRGSSRRTDVPDSSTSDPTDVTRRTAAELGAALAAGDVSAVEVTRAHLDRIAAVDGNRDDTGRAAGNGVHAFLHVAGEQALADAARVDDARARGERLGPLAG